MGIQRNLVICALLSTSVIVIFISSPYLHAIRLSYKNDVVQTPKAWAHWARVPLNFTRFAFVLQTAECLPKLLQSKEYFGNHTSCDCDVYVLSFKKPCQQTDPATALPHVTYIFNKSASWSVGRNLALSEAKRSKQNYLYYILMDDDVFLTYNDFTPKEYIDRKIPPVKIFTNFLKDYEPAGAGTDYSHWNTAKEVLNKWHSICKRWDTPPVLPVGHIDACFFAFHRNVLDTVLPYPESFDVKSYWLSTIQVTIAFQIAFHGQLVFFPQVMVDNPKHRINPNKGWDLLDDVNVRREMAENIRRHAPQQHKSHPVFERVLNYHIKPSTHTLCVDAPPPRSPVVPYRVMADK